MFKLPPFFFNTLGVGFYYLFIYLFLAVLGLHFCARAFSTCGKRGPTLHHSARASHYRGLSCCGAQAPDAQAQQLWLTGLAAPRHVGSSQTRARTRVPCIGRQILNHCATREALSFLHFIMLLGSQMFPLTRIMEKEVIEKCTINVISLHHYFYCMK